MGCSTSSQEINAVDFRSTPLEFIRESGRQADVVPPPGYLCDRHLTTLQCQIETAQYRAGNTGGAINNIQRWRTEVAQFTFPDPMLRTPVSQTFSKAATESLGDESMSDPCSLPTPCRVQSTITNAHHYYRSSNTTGPSRRESLVGELVDSEEEIDEGQDWMSVSQSGVSPAM
jgi:hypothetical protein